MITTDQLHRDLDQLRDAFEAFAFTFNSVVIQKGHIVLPTAEVTGRLASTSPASRSASTPTSASAPPSTWTTRSPPTARRPPSSSDSR